ncbi:aspartyl-phosphate phosphatase Spo0E family protein [Microaerobacter geothermalis]|uniref:aspartyl-phosphate phosphatase Spo0E family protein n=1 Tax=Microaerobacter geothermalis TaxID=674972 RepID=UPI001F2FEBF6|nr:aspartyl-phosphate phosphatase Spo0E family protein [Microaerobacter geothermalis]MCF6092455.1 aspartyl-phosphate phosphatase Spo0E family protein [Microaerobacter geothermalis]
MEKIEILRRKMEYLGKEKGLTDPTVLKYSKQIDKLHNMLLYIQHSQRRKVVKPKNSLRWTDKIKENPSFYELKRITAYK